MACVTLDKGHFVRQTTDSGKHFVMRTSLSRILEYPSLAAAQPLVVAGADHLHRPVRWIHSSEVLDIAHLLRGGEMLLTGGTGLAAALPPAQRAYVRELAARAVTAVAIETGPQLPAIPSAVVEEAEALGFPVIELRKVVPFVEVAEAINGALVNGSVTRLRFAGELSHQLSGILADGGGVQEVLNELVRRTGTRAAVFDSAGGVIASGATGEGAGPPHTPPLLGGVSSQITVRGVHAATLTLYPGSDADIEMLQVAQDRAAEALQLAVLRSRPPSARDFAASELVRLSVGSSPHPERLRRLGLAIGFNAGAPVVGVVAQADSPSSELARLDDLLRRHGTTAVDIPNPLAIHALLSLRDPQQAALTHTTLIDELHGLVASGRTTVAVGPVTPRLSEAPVSLGAAMECLHLPADGASRVIDATGLGIERMVLRDEFRLVAKSLVNEQLGLLLGLREQEREILLTTLETYFATGCNKTRTAAQLHLQRQSLYARLQRAFHILGCDPTGTPRALSLHLALRLRRHVG